MDSAPANIVPSKTRARLIAFYLPQFHPIPENDEWWGKGFTEWTNVAKAKPLFPGHYQPHIPADLGFYDLRVPETRIAQAEMAQSYGIEGFCYWHYWFAGKRLLERPFTEVLKSGEPKFPFCLAWANQSWSGIWHGAPDRLLIEQTYPGETDHTNHFYSLLDALVDERYLTIDDRKVLVIWKPDQLPDPKSFTDLWRELATKNGLRGLYFIGIGTPDLDPLLYGFDAAIVNVSLDPRRSQPALVQPDLSEKRSASSGKLSMGALHNWAYQVKRRTSKRTQVRHPKPSVFDYTEFVDSAFPRLKYEDWEYPMVLPNWDNTPRTGLNGIVFDQSSPELFKKHLRDGLNLVKDRTRERRIVFVKSWNEWAEGNYLEPDLRFGRAYLEVVRDVLHE